MKKLVAAAVVAFAASTFAAQAADPVVSALCHRNADASNLNACLQVTDVHTDWRVALFPNVFDFTTN